jgi:hypothetical protein
MQLVAYGAQDVYLTGNPQITFWKVTYRRYTNFAVESIEQTFNGQADFGRRVTCTISRNGDLASATYLQVTLPQIQTGAAPVPEGIGVGGTSAAYPSTLSAGAAALAQPTHARWLDYPGENIIASVDVEVGGQRIDRHYGDWMHIWNQLTIPAAKEDGYMQMVGNTTALTYIATGCGTAVEGPCATGATTCGIGCAPRTALPQTTLYVPLQFWFCQNPGLALPLIALQYHEVKIVLDFNFLDQMLWATSMAVDMPPNAPPTAGYFKKHEGTYNTTCLTSASLYVDYVFLDTDERRRMAQSPHEYLIEQLQFTGDQSIGSSANKIQLSFNHPVKELVWVVQPHCNVDYCASFACATQQNQLYGAQPFNYTDGLDGLPRNAWNYRLDHAGFTDMSNPDLMPNSFFDSRFAQCTGPYCNYGEVTVSTDAGESLQMRGVAANAQASNCSTDFINAAVTASGVFSTGTEVGAQGFSTTPQDGTYYTSAAPNTALRQFGLQAKHQNADPTVPNAACSSCSLNACPSLLCSPGAAVGAVAVNMSRDMSCWGENPMVTGKLLLNGQDRFSERLGSYFDLVQPFQHHTRTPDTGINVYSFALKPEEHQPSGTCNFSRIDNASLSIVVSANTVRAGGTANVRVYATNYNIFRVMSGMGGLAYSN